MLARLICVLMTVGWVWGQDAAGGATAAAENQLVTQAKQALTQMDAVLAAAKQTGEKIPPEDVEKFNHLRQWAQAMSERRWAEAYSAAIWLGEHDDFPFQMRLLAPTLQLAGLGTPKNVDAARVAIQSTADSGVVEAMELLGNAYESGGALAPSQDLELAFHWRQMAADRGSKTAQKYLARAYREGFGVKPDAEKASWYSAITGGVTSPPDPDLERIRKVLGQAAAATQPAIQRFDQGRFAEARTMLEPLAAQGDDYAQALLGYMYLDGKGLPKNAAKAVELFRQAVQKENPVAVYFLGVSAFSGMG